MTRPRRGSAGLWTQPPPDAAGAALRKEPFLPQEELIRVRNAAMEAGLADRALRPALLRGIPEHFTATLQPLSDPLHQIHADLNAMNQVERLIDGLVPLEIWLHNAIEQTHEQGPRTVLQGALDTVAREITGEAALSLDMMPVEVKEEIVLQDDTVPYEFLHGGIRAGASVALLRIPPYESGAPLLPSYPHSGTGWMVAPGLLITNHHVVMARSWDSGIRPFVADEDLRLQALMSRSRFDFVESGTTPPEVTAGELAAWDAALDYAVVRLASEDPRGRPSGSPPDRCSSGSASAYPSTSSSTRAACRSGSPCATTWCTGRTSGTSCTSPTRAAAPPAPPSASTTGRWWDCTAARRRSTTSSSRAGGRGS